MLKLSAGTRWAVPVGAVAAVGVVIAASAVASASEPSLPARSAAQLLTEVQQAAARPLSPLTATIQETANLGIPALPQIGALGGGSGPAGSLSPLAGTTTVNVWYLNPQHLRLAEPTQMGESDLRLDGTRLWLWNSKDQTATHVLLPAAALYGSKAAAPKASASKASASKASATIGSPAAAARQLLAAVGPSTSVRVGPNVTVAGRAAYQLSITPRASGSLVSHVLIAVDASTHVPLQVQVDVRGSSSPAFQLGFTSLAFGAPAASNFTFSPPSGAKVKTVTVPDKPPAGLGKDGLSGLLGGVPGLGGIGLGGPSIRSVRIGGLSAPVAIVSGSGSATYGSSPTVTMNAGPGQATNAYTPLPRATAKRLRAAFLAGLPKGMTSAQRAAIIKAFDAKLAARAGGKGGWYANSPLTKASYSPLPGLPSVGLGAGAPRVLGSGWTSVLATPASPAVAAALRQLLTDRTAISQQGAGVQTAQGGFLQSTSSASASASASAAAPVPVGPYLAVLRALLKTSTAVKGSWGSGRLLQTALLTVLVTSKGQILAGAVTPAVLFADAASLSR